MNTSREKILNKVKKGTSIPSKLPIASVEIDRNIAQSLKSITPQDIIGLREQFKNELELVSGEFHFVRNENEAATLLSEIVAKNNYEKVVITGEKLPQDIANKIRENSRDVEFIHAMELEYPERKNKLAAVPAALVKASFAIADTGSLVFLYDESLTSLPHFLSDCIFVVIRQQQLITNQFELFNRVPPEKARNMVFVAGPSRTADIEKVLILGAHGPHRLIVVMLED